MARRRGLTEEYVKKVALNYLTALYTPLSANQKVFAGCEMTVQCRDGRGRTDIFISYRDKESQIRTVVVEAKSHKTLSSILYKTDEPIQDVFTQLSRYPADERWVALSSDMLNLCRIRDREMLLTICGEFGYGLLVVSSGNRVEQMLTPQAREVFGLKDTLQFYPRSQEVIQSIQS